MLRPNRRRAPLLVILLAVVALLGTSCKQDNTPSEYNSVTQQNFIDGCTGNTSDDGATGNTANAGNGPATTLAPQSACECAYDWIVVNVPYNDANKDNPVTVDGIGEQNFTYTDKTFKAINDDLTNNPGNMPDEIQQGIAKACNDKGWKVASTTTTAPAGGGGPTTVPQ